MLKVIAVLCAVPMLFTACNNPQNNTNTKTSTNDTATKSTVPAPPPRPSFTYRTMRVKDSLAQLKTQYDTNQLRIIYALNRVDAKHAQNIDTMIIPNKVDTNFVGYSPFPQSVPGLKDVNKIVIFSYPAQAFAAYDHGQLVRSGPTSMGRKKDPTPTGLTYVNWKKLVDTSSVKDEWVLKWNVNILNKGGVGFHEYDLPGYPASHSCLRLLDNDAEYMYNWVTDWIMKGSDDIVAHGTPVIVFGEYPYGGPKPWLALAQNPHALDVTADYLQQLVQPNLQQIITEQQKLATALAAKKK
jgi:lipoprotein-anchoring transpeptidase ErfK/SrfK